VMLLVLLCHYFTIEFKMCACYFDVIIYHCVIEAKMLLKEKD